jgi:signal transduction histidine kinase
MAVEKTLARNRGFPQVRVHPRGRPLRRILSTALGVAALVASVVATAASLGGYADPGVEAGRAGSTVAGVAPAGFAWRTGIRAGQVVVRVQDSSAPGGWLIETADGNRHFLAREELYDAALRGLLPISVAAIGFGGLALVFLRGHRSWVAIAACAAFLCATPALELYGKPESSTPVMAAAALIPAAWIAWRPRVPAILRGVAAVLLAALVIAWAVARLAAYPLYDELELVRGTIALLATGLVMLLSVVVPLIRNDPLNVSRPRISDIAVVGIAAGIALASVSVFAIPPAVVGIVAFSALLALPSWRQVLGPRLERLLLTDVREHVSLEAAESERAHLARELHDAPLQELAGGIRRLELLPGAGPDTDRLREVADQLRSVATELRPPVLDDLGVAAAIEFLAEKATSASTVVVARVTDESALSMATRPPADVELATFRIVQEAISNALRHAEATEIRVAGIVGPRRIELEVLDNGRGLVDDEVRAAARQGRLGLASIRRRAQAIDAEVTIERSAPGTRVWLRWEP